MDKDILEIVKEMSAAGLIANTTRAQAYLHKRLEDSRRVTEVQLRAKINYLESTNSSLQSRLDKASKEPEPGEGIVLGYHSVADAWYFDSDLFTREIEVGYYREKEAIETLSFFDQDGVMVLREAPMIKRCTELLKYLLLNLNENPTYEDMLKLLKGSNLTDLTERKKFKAL